MEQTLSLPAPGQDIAATLTTPEGPPPWPVVLMLHGFTGTRDERIIPATGEGVFARTARQLAKQGLASLRIDCRGSGDSVGAMQFADTTFEGQVTDALIALEELRRGPYAALHLLGWSQGGLVATAVAARAPDVAALALWNAVADPLGAFTGLLGPAAFDAAALAPPDQPVAVTLPWGQEIALKPGFFDGVRRFDPLAELAAYPGPLLVAQGTRDTLVEPASAAALLAAHAGPQTRYTAAMDHSFDIDRGTEALARLIVRTGRFFRESGAGVARP